MLVIFIATRFSLLLGLFRVKSEEITILLDITTYHYYKLTSSLPVILTCSFLPIKTLFSKTLIFCHYIEMSCFLRTQSLAHALFPTCSFPSLTHLHNQIILERFSSDVIASRKPLHFTGLLQVCMVDFLLFSHCTLSSFLSL